MDGVSKMGRGLLQLPPASCSHVYSVRSKAP